MSKRKAMSKRLRFSIFDRDQYTCQYCGCTPPSVKLVIDHIIPVSGGGTDDPENLRTSCASCNAGKSDKPIGKEVNQSDALRRAQEALESVDTAKAFAEALEARNKLQQDVTNFICGELCADSCKKCTVSSIVMATEKHGAELVMRWFSSAVSRTSRYGKADEINAAKYFHGILRRVGEQEKDGTP